MAAALLDRDVLPAHAAAGRSDMEPVPTWNAPVRAHPPKDRMEAPRRVAAGEGPPHRDRDPAGRGFPRPPRLRRSRLSPHPGGPRSRRGPLRIRPGRPPTPAAFPPATTTPTTSSARALPRSGPSRPPSWYGERRSAERHAERSPTRACVSGSSPVPPGSPRAPARPTVPRPRGAAGRRRLRGPRVHARSIAPPRISLGETRPGYDVLAFESDGGLKISARR